MEKPSTKNIAPQETQTSKVVFRADSTEAGYIFGYILYSSPSGNIPHIIPLDHIKLNFLDVIYAQPCSQNMFKTMWAEFIWENKISLQTKNMYIDIIYIYRSPYQFIKKLSKDYNLFFVSSLTEEDKESDVLAVNLYGKSKFGIYIFIYIYIYIGEDLLANVSAECTEAGDVNWCVKLRAKTKSLALALGEHMQSPE